MVDIANSDLRMVLTDRNRRIAGGAPSQSRREPDVAVFSSYSGGVALVEVGSSGAYQLVIEARHDAPPPVELMVGVNGVPLKQFALARGDNSWEQVQFDLQLVPGIHAVNVWFTNDFHTDADDRNLFVRRITLAKMPSAVRQPGAATAAYASQDALQVSDYRIRCRCGTMRLCVAGTYVPKHAVAYDIICLHYLAWAVAIPLTQYSLSASFSAVDRATRAAGSGDALALAPTRQPAGGAVAQTAARRP
jgi:hypothetical protein